jgi:hypothetical protein
MENVFAMMELMKLAMIVEFVQPELFIMPFQKYALLQIIANKTKF